MEIYVDIGETMPVKLDMEVHPADAEGICIMLLDEEGDECFVTVLSYNQLLTLLPVDPKKVARRLKGNKEERAKHKEYEAQCDKAFEEE